MNGIIEAFPRCAVCSEPAGQVCSGCRAEHYCGKVHQKQAWRAGHRLKCSIFRLEVDDIRGRHLVATRDIKQGEIILKEKPAILGPKIVGYPTCLACYKRVIACKQLDGKVDYNKCTKCGWPMCGSGCQSSPIHKEECELMTARKFKSTITYNGQDNKESAYCVITPLRCLLLKDSSPKQYEAITSLEDHLEDRINTPLYRILKANIVTFVQQILGLTQFDDERIMKIVAILDTNAYDIRYKENEVKLRGIYLTASMRSHDCNPNTKHVYSNDGYLMTVMATVDIPKGSMLTTSYTQPLWGTLARRTHMLNSKCFWCTCDRCKDPTELGTYLGAIYCNKCYMNSSNKEPKEIPKITSTDPLNNAADWKCEVCDHKIAAKQMVWGNDSFKKDIQMLNHTNPKDFEEFIIKYEQLLHPSNCHLIEVKYALCQMYGHIKGFTYDDLNDAAINRKIALCEEIMEILNTLNPGLSQARGIILLELQETMVIKTRKDLAASKITREAAQSLMEECMELLQEATMILKSEPEMHTILQERLNALVEELNVD